MGEFQTLESKTTRHTKNTQQGKTNAETSWTLWLYNGGSISCFG